MTLPKHSVSVAGVTFDEHGRVLVIRRRDNGEWQAPGGVLELGETFEEGVRREVLEETGVDVDVERLTGFYQNLVKGVVALVFRCRHRAGDPHSTAESAEVAWRPVDLAVETMSPAFAVRVRDAEAPQAVTRVHDGVHLL